MKIRDSGMPEQEYWETLFNPADVIDGFGWSERTFSDGQRAIELGCGYGTFTQPLAHFFTGRLDTFDLEPEMIKATRNRFADAAPDHLHLHAMDFLDGDLPLATDGADVAVLFHIMHLDEPLPILHKVADRLRPGGSIAILHWRSDHPTPRGPAMELRPTPQLVAQWATLLGASTPRFIPLPRCPHHHAFEILLP